MATQGRPLRGCGGLSGAPQTWGQPGLDVLSAADCAGVQGCFAPVPWAQAGAPSSSNTAQAGFTVACLKPAPVCAAAAQTPGRSGSSSAALTAGLGSAPGDLRSARFCCSRCGRDLSGAGFAQRVAHVKKCAAAGPLPGLAGLPALKELSVFRGRALGSCSVWVSQPAASGKACSCMHRRYASPVHAPMQQHLQLATLCAFRAAWLSRPCLSQAPYSPRSGCRQRGARGAAAAGVPAVPPESAQGLHRSGAGADAAAGATSADWRPGVAVRPGAGSPC